MGEFAEVLALAVFGGLILFVLGSSSECVE